MTLDPGPGGVVLEVRDDGRGFEPRNAAGAGLRGMRERALLVGGTLEFDSGADGTALRLTLPPAR